nr:MAG TPA: hypothetical protein [Caudoviricetes sp.]
MAASLPLSGAASVGLCTVLRLMSNCGGKKWNNTSSLISKILLSEPRQEDFIFRTEPM